MNAPNYLEYLKAGVPYEDLPALDDLVTTWYG